MYKFNGEGTVPTFCFQLEHPSDSVTKKRIKAGNIVTSKPRSNSLSKLSNLSYVGKREREMSGYLVVYLVGECWEKEVL